MHRSEGLDRVQELGPGRWLELEENPKNCQKLHGSLLFGHLRESCNF